MAILKVCLELERLSNIAFLHDFGLTPPAFDIILILSLPYLYMIVHSEKKSIAVQGIEKSLFHKRTLAFSSNAYINKY